MLGTKVGVNIYCSNSLHPAGVSNVLELSLCVREEVLLHINKPFLHVPKLLPR